MGNALPPGVLFTFCFSFFRLFHKSQLRGSLWSGNSVLAVLHFVGWTYRMSHYFLSRVWNRSLWYGMCNDSNKCQMTAKCSWIVLKAGCFWKTTDSEFVYEIYVYSNSFHSSLKQAKSPRTVSPNPLYSILHSGSVRVTKLTILWKGWYQFPFSLENLEFLVPFIWRFYFIVKLVFQLNFKGSNQ